MIKLAAAAAALAAFATSSAFAQTAYITPGIYSVTTEYTAVTNDTSSLCASAGVTAGTFTTGLAYVGGENGTIHSIVPQPAPAADSTVKVNNLTCDFGALPATLSTTASTAYAGNPTCTASYSQALVNLGAGPSATYTLTGGTGLVSQVIPQNKVKTKPVQTVPLNTANSFHLSTTSAVISIISPAIGPICNVSVDSLYVRVGK